MPLDLAHRYCERCISCKLALGEDFTVVTVVYGKMAKSLTLSPLRMALRADSAVVTGVFKIAINNGEMANW